MTEVRALCICAQTCRTPLTPTLTATRPCTVSRLYAHSKNYDMELTLDYNIELFPLQAGQSFALALASSLSRIPQGVAGAADDEEKDRDVWRPDAKGRRGLDDDYEYVMYGKVRTTAFPYLHCPNAARSLHLSSAPSTSRLALSFLVICGIHDLT